MLIPGTTISVLTQRAKRRLGFRDSEGSTIVEFALVSSAFLGFMLLIIETSLAVYSYDFVSEAARDCARYAIVRGKSSCNAAYSPQMPDCAATEAQIQTHLRSLNYPGINTSNLTATVAWYPATPVTSGSTSTMTWPESDTCNMAVSGSPSPTSCKAAGNAVDVTVNYQYPFIVPFVKSATISMSNSSMMVISQ